MKENLHYLKTCPYKEYLKTNHWKGVVREIRKRDNYTCRLCANSGDNVHHNTYEHRGEELRYKKDLITLCNDCHILFHFLKNKDEDLIYTTNYAKCIDWLMRVIIRTKLEGGESSIEIVKQKYTEPNFPATKKYNFEQILELSVANNFVIEKNKKYTVTKKGVEFCNRRTLFIQWR